MKSIENNIVGIVQVDTIAGDFEYNAKKIAKYIKKSESMGLDLLVFPKFSLTGYINDKLLLKYPYLGTEILKWIDGLSKLTKNTTVIVSFMNINKTTNSCHDSVAVLQNGQITKIIEDFQMADLKSATFISNDKCYTLISSFDISKSEINNNKTDALIYLNAGISTLNGMQNMRNKLSNFASKLQIPLVYANLTGASDCYSFEGSSCIFDTEGALIASAKSFQEDFLTINPFIVEKKDTTMVKDKWDENINFMSDYEYDLERVYNSVLQGIRDYFTKCSLKRAVIGLSGGLDSTVCAVLLSDAIGEENVFGVLMPSVITSDESNSDAEKLAKNLGIGYTKASIERMVNVTNECLNPLFKDIENSWNCRYKKSFTQDNIQARSRAIYLWSVSNEFEACIPIATSDKSELYMGYATINGDMSGGFAPIADITKTKLFALARWMNKNRAKKNVIPQNIILKKPGAELAIDSNTGKPLCAEDALMPYEFLDEIIWRIEKNKNSYEDLLNATFLYETRNKLAIQQKKEWLDKFFKRMSSALYKWSIMPPSVILDSDTINKNIYSQPITSSHIDYIGKDEKTILDILKVSS